MWDKAKDNVYDPKNREVRRKCFKCGKSPIADNVKLFRFPKPAMRNTVRCLLWAKFMFPGDKSKYASSVFQMKLHTEHRMLCENHFLASDFVDYTRLKFINKDVVPFCVDETEVTSKDVVDSNADHSYTNKKEPPPPSQPILFNLRPKVDSTAANTSQAINVSGVEPYQQTQESQSVQINDLDDIASADQIDEDTGPLFSWQAPSQISVEDEGCDVVPSVATTTNEQNLPKKMISQDLTMEHSGNPIEIDGLEEVDNVAKEDTTLMVTDEVIEYKSENHVGYSCDHCMGDIIGFRYKCVQCENYDLCRACESRLVHPHHYVLRLPRPTAFNEVKSMIEAIRERIKILSEEIKETSDSLVLDDIKEEAPFEEVQVDPFQELDAIDTVPDIPIEGTDMPTPIPGGSGVMKETRKKKNAETRRILKEWDLDSETVETTSEDLEIIDTTKGSKKMKLSSVTAEKTSEDLEIIDSTKGSKEKNVSSTNKSRDTQTLNLDEMRQQYFDSKWRDEINLTTQEDIRHIENSEIEWLDESILESEVTFDIERSRSDKSKKKSYESVQESGGIKVNRKEDRSKMIRDLKDSLSVKDDEGKNKQDGGNTRSDQELKSSEQEQRKGKRKVTQKAKVDPEEILLKSLTQTDRKRVNILSKSSKIKRLNS